MSNSSRLIAIICFALLFFIPATFKAEAQEQVSPPEGYRQLPDLIILGESAFAQWGGGGQGLSLTLNGEGKVPRLAGESYAGSPVYRLDVTGDPSQGGWWQLLLAGKDWEAYSIAPYIDGGALEMNLRFQTGTEDFVLVLNDIVPGRDPLNVESSKINISNYTTATTDWQAVRIPLTDLLGADGQFRPTQMFTIGMGGASFDTITVDFNQVRFTSPALEPASPTVKLNQIGYTPNGLKSVRISGFPDQLSAQAGTPFEIRSLTNNEVAYTGLLEELSPFDARVSGERVLEARFDTLTEPGSYYLAVQSYQIEDSPTFEIRSDLYDGLLYDSLRYFSLQRSGIAIEATYAGEYFRPVGHPQDQAVALRSGERDGIDVSGGWYDAGDYGKYTNAGATAVSDLLWTWEMFSDRLSDDQFNLPESGNGVPDILDEVRWELEWILKMQDPASGGFYHMVQPTEDLPSADALEPRYIEDTEGGRTNIRPTSTTGSAVAALAHGATVFEALDPDFAAEMRAAAEAGWAYLEANPNGVLPMEGPYSDKVDGDNRFWAATTLYRLTGEAQYHDYIRAVYPNVETFFESTTDNAYGVNDMGMIGWLAYLYSDNQDQAVADFFETRFTGWADHMLARWDNSIWGHTLLDDDYYWGSNYVVLTTPLVMYVGAEGLGNERLKGATTAISQTGLDYLLGTNPLSFSYITGFGENSVQNLYSVQWSADSVPQDPPGIMVGGPNEYTNPLIPSNFSGKRYIDGNSFWTLNEHTIYWNSPIVFHSAMQLGEPNTVVALEQLAVDPTPEPTPEPTAVPEAEAEAETIVEERADESSPSDVIASVPETAAEAETTPEQGPAQSDSLLIGIIIGLAAAVLILGVGLYLLWQRVRRMENS